LQTKDDPEYWVIMGYSLEREGKTDKAQKYYEKALELDPDNFIAMNNLAKILSNRGQNDEALKIFKYLTKANPKTPKGGLILALAIPTRETWMTKRLFIIKPLRT
jgi:tetratricopeptide (TPR) repeat protein